MRLPELNRKILTFLDADVRAPFDNVTGTGSFGFWIPVIRKVVERWCHGRDRLDGHGQGRTAYYGNVTIIPVMVTLLLW